MPELPPSFSTECLNHLSARFLFQRRVGYGSVNFLIDWDHKPIKNSKPVMDGPFWLFGITASGDIVWAAFVQSVTVMVESAAVLEWH
jgi:hypothetical protein